MFGYIILALLFLWGLLMVLKPDVIWSLENSDTLGKKEPTQGYLKGMRVGGIVCMVLAAALFVFFFV